MAISGAPAELTWVTPEGVGVHLIEDENLDLTYLALENTSIRGASDYDLLEVRRSISAEFETIEIRELIDLYRQAPEWNAKVLILMMLAAATQEDHSSSICTVIEDGIKFHQADVRRASAIASMYTPWPELQPVIESAATRDPDQQVRDLAAASLLNFSQRGLP
ncbi:hypothetical protein [Streptomyces sp. NPDC056672]|uniref:hypothetical protein n=1 Tax=Streptomyces sp. NPDC056672 TaxID=3345906 RepID=UPI0036946E42